MRRAAILLLMVLLATTARGDGGIVRLSERQGRHRITVFTAPTPARVGPLDVSVLVQDALTGAPLFDAVVTVVLRPEGQAEPAFSGQASRVAATNKLFQAVLFELPSPGRWQVDVEVERGLEIARSRFTFDAEPPLPRWVDMAFWLGWPALPIALYALREVLVWRRRTTAGASRLV